MTIDDNIKNIKQNIDTAAKKAGRSLNDITLIAVTKTISADFLNNNIDAFLSNNVTHFGENRVQELMDKQPHITDQITWHMIGNLQRNKVKYIADKVVLVHSLDSAKLATELSRIATRDGIHIDALIEINIANEDTKHGISPNDVDALINEVLNLPNISIKGLMTVAPYVQDPNENREHFKKMYSIYTKLKERSDLDIKYLSMGMTNDYEVAIEEGANMVRVGTGIFGSR